MIFLHNVYRFEKGLNTGCNRRGYFGYFSTAFRKIKKTDKQFKKKHNLFLTNQLNFYLKPYYLERLGMFSEW